jgi:hypothetical protein
MVEYGEFVAPNSATARNALIAAFWDTTQLTAYSVAVPTSVAHTYGFVVEFILAATSTTALTVSGSVTWWGTGATNLGAPALAPTSNTGLSSSSVSIDLRFAMSAALASEQWLINSVTVERVL